MSNRTTAKSNIVTLNVPTVTNAILNDMLNGELADNVVFREDVAVNQVSAISNITVDFSGKDRVNLTRTGGNLVITLANIGDGETKFLLVTKTAGQAVTWVGVTDITPIKANANALSLVLYEIVRKGANYFAWAWVENVKTATDSIEGVLPIATAVEVAALTSLVKMVVPGRIPIASTTQKGVIEIANSTEANALSDTTRALTPGNVPISSTTQKGLIEVATAAENDAGSAGNLAVIASELKRKLDELQAYIGFRVVQRFRWDTGTDTITTYTNIWPLTSHGLNNATGTYTFNLGAHADTTYTVLAVAEGTGLVKISQINFNGGEVTIRTADDDTANSTNLYITVIAFE